MSDVCTYPHDYRRLCHIGHEHPGNLLFHLVLWLANRSKSTCMHLLTIRERTIHWNAASQPPTTAYPARLSCKHVNASLHQQVNVRSEKMQETIVQAACLQYTIDPV
jgi:hypothetical protein